MALICPGERRVHRSSDQGCYLSSAHSGLYTVVKIESGLWWSSFVGGWSERNPQKGILHRGSSHYFSSFLLCQLHLCTLPRSVSVCVCLTSAKGNRILPPLTHTHTHKVRSQISSYLQLEHWKSRTEGKPCICLCLCWWGVLWNHSACPVALDGRRASPCDVHSVCSEATGEPGRMTTTSLCAALDTRWHKWDC